MYHLISRKFLICIEPKREADRILIRAFAKTLVGETVKEIPLTQPNFIQPVFEEIGRYLCREHHNIIAADIITCIKKQWWQYKSTIYGLHLEIQNNGYSNEFLTLLEIYTRFFSLEFSHFYQHLSVTEKSIIEDLFSGDFSADPYYSELLDAKQFIDTFNQLKQ